MPSVYSYPLWNDLQSTVPRTHTILRQCSQLPVCCVSMSGVTCQVSCIICFKVISDLYNFFFYIYIQCVLRKKTFCTTNTGTKGVFLQDALYICFFLSDKVVELIRGGSVINGATPSCLYLILYILGDNSQKVQKI